MLSKNLSLFLCAFSLAALSFLPIWSIILNTEQYYDYPIFIYEPIFCLLTLLWLCVWTGIIAISLKCSYRPILCVVTFFFVMIPLLILGNTIRLEWGPAKNLNMVSLWTLGALFFSLSAYFFIKRRQIFLEVLRIGLFIALPFALLVTAKTLWLIIEQLEDSKLQPQTMLADKNIKSSPRILWMIFDELDIRFAFEHKGDRCFQNLEEFKNNSLYATQAYAAESDTLHSIPAMFSGLNLTNPRIQQNSDVQFINVETQQKITWKEAPNIFHKAQQMGLKTAILGNYHPYEKIFGSEVDYCLPSCIPEMTFFKKISIYSRLLFHTIIFNGIPLVRRSGLFNENIIREIFIETYQHMLNKAIPIISNPDYNFIYIHWTIPHAPGIYQSSNKQFNSLYQADYWDNLALVDETLGKIRQISTNERLWDSTIVIVTSDHWLRQKTLDSDMCSSLDANVKDLICNPDYRVPLMIKMPNQKEPFLYSGKFRMYHIHNLLELMLNGSFDRSEDVINWMKTKEPDFTLEGLQ